MIAGEDYFQFSLQGNKYLFYRNSFSILNIPQKLTTSTNENIKKILREEEKKAKIVDNLTLRTVALNLTNRCNFTCSYCFANHGLYDKPGLTMSEEIATKVIDLLFENITNNKQKRAAITFFGGEPLLEWELLQKIVCYAEKNKPSSLKRLKFLITTNASLLDRPKINFLKKHSFSVMISIDGPPKSHDLNRKLANGAGTYHKILSNIIEANKILPVTFRATITNNNLDLVKIVRHFKKLGAKIIIFGLDNDGLKKDNYYKIMKFYKKLANLYLRDIIEGNFYEITNFSDALLQIVFKERKISHCNAGLSYLGISADGSMYKCPRFTGFRDHRFGSVLDENEMIKKQKAFKIGLKENAGSRNKVCFNCPFVLLCGGLCHYDLFRKGKTDSDLVEEQCQLRKCIYKEVIKLYVRIPSQTKKEFLLSLLDQSRKGVKVDD